VESDAGWLVQPHRATDALNRNRVHAWRTMVAAAAVALCLGGCATLPPPQGRTASYALGDTGNTQLGRAVATLAAAHPGTTGVHALPLGSDGFAARMLLAGAAERSLDLQYYIWHGDQAGYLLLEQVWRAAERGVRVRMLLDDANTEGFDGTIATLAAHPNIEVRLYNPLVYRRARALNFAVDFKRVNRRMHNKSFTADNQIAVVGGRNIGNEYFGAGDDVPFRDLDVIAVGQAVKDVSAEFDLYWNSPSAYPARALVQEPADRARLEEKFAALREDVEAIDYARTVRATPLVQQLLAGRLGLEWTRVEVVRDDPAKTLDTEGRTDILLLSSVLQKMGQPAASFDLISPYFVPGEEGTASLASLAHKGVRIRVLTNSLASTDVMAVHAGYAKRRCSLLQAGIQLYELELSGGAASDDKKTFGSSGQTRLHAKTFAADRQRIFVGSFNFDPRSARLNTEMGLIIDSPQLAQRLSRMFDHEVPRIAYTVVPGTEGRCVEWTQATPGGEVRYTTEPGTRPSQRALIDFLSHLPIDWLL
jgi:putative cardiolipin synthase